MTERKKKIDMHFKIASKLLTEIKSRSIDKLQDIEEEILSSKKLTGENKTDFETIISSAPPTTDRFTSLLDKLRVVLTIILVMDDVELMQNSVSKIEEMHS